MRHTSPHGGREHLLVHARITTDEADVGEMPTYDESHGIVSDLSVNKDVWVKLFSRLKLFDISFHCKELPSSVPRKPTASNLK